MSKSTLTKGKTTGATKSAGTPKSSAKNPGGSTTKSPPKTAKPVTQPVTKPAEASAAPSASKAAPQRSATQRSGSARPTRQEQWEQHRLERQRKARAEQRRRLFQRVGWFGGGTLVLALIIYFIVNAFHPNPTPSNLITGTGTYTTAADGSTRDGMNCLSTEGAVVHIHMYLAIYVDGKQVQVPPDTGIVNGGTCLYPLHVHSDAGDANIIHEESPTNATYTLGAFFDIWGEPLSSKQMMTYKADATHTLTFVTIDGNGHKTVVKGNPLNIQFTEHETIYILYNSPHVTLTPFTQWLPGE